jgi:hypothetical protein
VLGSSVFDGVEFRVEWLLGELTRIIWPLIILLIRKIWVSCGEHLERPHIEGSQFCVTKVDMVPQYHMHID